MEEWAVVYSGYRDEPARASHDGVNGQTATPRLALFRLRCFPAVDCTSARIRSYYHASSTRVHQHQDTRGCVGAWDQLLLELFPQIQKNIFFY